MGTEGGGEGVEKESVVAVGCGFEILDVLYCSAVLCIVLQRFSLFLICFAFFKSIWHV